MPLAFPAWPPDWPEIEAAAVAAIRSGSWGDYHSSLNRQLTETLAERFQASDVRLTCSGSAAIEISLRAAGVGAGDEVILAAFDYPGNFRAVELVGARPVLIDLEPDSVRPSPTQLEAAASEQVKAVIVSHLFGVAAEIAEFRRQCEERRWLLIEDACQVPGMMITGRPAGSFGHVATLSFGGSKPLTSGSGGAILTSDPRLAARLGPILDRPSDAMPLSPLQAAVLMPQMEKLDPWNERRRQTARFIEEQTSASLSQWLWLSRSDAEVSPSHYKVAWAAKNESHRARIVRTAAEMGIPIGEGFHAMSRSSQRRCRKPVPLDVATRMGESAFVLDHSALLLEPDRHHELRQMLASLHERTAI